MSLKLVSALSAGLALAACASNPKQDPGRLGFMVGCWESANSVNQEVWSYPRGGMMFGYASTLKNDALSTWEQTIINLAPTRSTYTASPEGQRPVTFIEVSPPAPGEQTAVTFENGDHDYPQRIQYRQTKDGLAATISKLDGSRPVDYTWTHCR